MIKVLALFFAALLFIGTAIAQFNPHLLLPMVGPAPAPGNIACDSGPTYTGTIPAGAQKAGFTHCVLNGDFTTATYSTTSTWLNECGASNDSINSTWHLLFSTLGNPNVSFSNSQAPCNRLDVTTDGGFQVVHYQYQPADSPNTMIVLSWPAGDWPFGPCGSNNGHGLDPTNPTSCVGGPNYTGLTNNNYVEITFRIPSTSLSQAFTHDSAMIDFWQDQCNGGPCNAGFYDGTAGEPEIDFFETHSAYLTGSPLQMRLVGYGDCPGATDSASCIYADATNYHTYGYLFTNAGDGPGTTAQCLYIDGVLQLNPCVSLTGYTRNTTGKLITVWLSAGECFGQPPCTVANFEIFIKSIRVWSCLNNWTSPCIGPLVTSALETPMRFAWWDNIKRIIGSVIGTAQAQEMLYDPFAGDFGGLWFCPDGTLGNKYCAPIEFRNVEWWKECLPGRSDCRQSKTAFIGYVGANRWPQRGLGYCYTQQPYTCSPDGKVPE